MSDDKPEAEKPETTSALDDAGEEPRMADEKSPEAAETEPTDSERTALQMTDKPKADEPQRDGDSREHAAHGHGDGHGHAHDAHAHGGGHDHGLAHTTPVSLLFGILTALLVLTIVTVAVTTVDLGAQGNLVVAMVIATIKAALVCTFFMHLLWDKKFNTILFLTSVLFLILFLSMATTDRGEYQNDVDAYRAQQLAPK
jgi:cytochrome c oxidase subunit IV